MMKRFFSLVAAALTLVACSTDDNYSLDYFFNKYGNSGQSDTTVVTTPDTLNVAIVYNGTAATLTGDVSQITVSRQGADIIVTSETEKYLLLTLSGTSDNGSLNIYNQRKYGIVLNGLKLTNPVGPAINNQCGKALYVTLADGTTNTLADGTSYQEQAIDQKGTLFSEGQIYFQGTGSLVVNGNTKNGIASDDFIVIEEGTFTVNVSETGSNGIKVNDGFTINGGTLTIDVKANGARGIKCDARTTISGGQTTITTSGDCEISTVDGIRDTTSAAGIKSDSLFVMSAGTLTITSSGDGGKGINCAENVEFKGGTLNITTTGSNDIGKPKGVKSDTGIIVSGGSFSVTVSKSWACDNGSESDDPKDHVTVLGTPVTQNIYKKSVIINY